MRVVHRDSVLPSANQAENNLETNNLNENAPPQEQSAAAEGQNQQNQPGGRRRRRRRRRGGSGAQNAQPNGSAEVRKIEASGGEGGEAPAYLNGAAQSATNGQSAQGEGAGSGRRRRRNRRKKGGSQQQTNGGQQNFQGERQPKHVHNGSSIGMQGKGSGGRRNRGGRRGGAQFVGPMDHLYRSTDNLADSTVGLNGNFRAPQRSNGFNPNANGNIASYAESVTVPVREDAPTRVFCFIEDLFFHAKIRETARQVGLKVEFVKNDKEQIEHVLEVAGQNSVLVIVDLNNLNAKPIALIKKLRPKLKKGSSIIGFVSHVQGELKVEASEAGCDVVMPRSAFSSNLPNILRRYIDDNEEDEPNFNSEAIPY